MIIRDIKGIHIGFAAVTVVEIAKPDTTIARLILHASGRNVGAAAANGYDVLLGLEPPADVATEPDRLLRRIQLSFPSEQFATMGAQFGGVVAAAQLNQMGFFTTGDRNDRIVWPGYGLYHRVPALAGSEQFEYRYIFAEIPASEIERLVGA